MHIVIAPDSFKESLKASEAARCIALGIKKVLPDAVCEEVPMADGGEGTVDALVNATGGTIKKIKVKDPHMRDIESYYGILGDGNTAVIEMAAASGLELLKENEKNPWATTTFGTGQLIKAALNAGCKKIITGIGGSATNDGGTGMARALGAVFLDRNGYEIGHGGGPLENLAEIRIDGLDKRIRECDFLVASDVQNPLCGKQGASRVYGPQKGATAGMADRLDKNLLRYGRKLEGIFKREIIDLPGAGAAGGLGAGLVAFLNAALRPGFDIVNELTGLEEKIKNAGLVITGEGKLDEQTRYGKTPSGVADLAKKYNKPVIGIAGSLGEGYDELYHHGFTAIFSIMDKPMPLEEALANAPDLLQNTTEAIFRTLIMAQDKLLD